jgi:hypothetical protein
MATGSAFWIEASRGVWVYDCPDCKSPLWWVPCVRCGGHYSCVRCPHEFILRVDGWYRILPRFDTLEKVGA